MNKKCESFFFASTLDVELSFYNDGILRTLITEPNNPEENKVFRTSSIEGVLTLERLSPISDIKEHSGIESGKLYIDNIISKGAVPEVHSFVIDLQNFQID